MIVYDEIFIVEQQEFDDYVEIKKGKKWMILKEGDGKLNYIYIYQVIKVFLF